MFIKALNWRNNEVGNTIFYNDLERTIGCFKNIILKDYDSRRTYN